MHAVMHARSLSLLLPDRSIISRAPHSLHTATGCSAHWCPPCRGFTPKLAESYSGFKASSHPRKEDFSVVFVSSDRSEESFNEYFAEMPWLALPYAERDLKAKLSSKFKVGQLERYRQDYHQNFISPPQIPTCFIPPMVDHRSAASPP